MEKRVPAVYTAEEVAELLNMKKSTAYTYIKDAYEKKTAFPVVKICGQYRIPIKSFHIWLDGFYEEDED